MSRLTLLLLLSMAAYVSADSDFVEEIKKMQPFVIQSSAYACPVPIVGQACPEANPLFYFKCCGELAKDCCFRLQDWVTVLLVVLAVLIVLSIIINFIRCLFCY